MSYHYMYTEYNHVHLYNILNCELSTLVLAFKEGKEES